MRLTMSDEEKLLKIREFLKKTKVNKKIITDCCIICLDSFENCTSINHTISQENKIEKNVENNDNIEYLERDTNVNTNMISNEERDIQIEMESINNENNIPIHYDTTDNKISTLPCGHRYHVKCITDWMLHRKNTCPMCREKIDPNMPDINGEDLQNELLNIQIELHPAFALLVFQTINEELTWGAMTLPVINGGLLSGITGFAFI